MSSTPTIARAAAAAGTVTPIERRLVSEAVFERLLADVMAGRLEPGDALPSERALSEGFAVNRHAVREALKRLQQAGLVAIGQGGATRVRDWRAEAGLDVLTSLIGVATGAARAALLRDVLELRACVGVDAARRCAERAPGATTADLLARYRPQGDGMAPTVPGVGGGFAARAEAYVAFWAAIVAGAGNLATRLAFNTLVAAQRHGDLDPRIYAAEIDDAAAQAALAAAIAARDPDAAAAVAGDLLGRTLAAAMAGDLPGRTPAAAMAGDLPGRTPAAAVAGDLPGRTRSAAVAGDLPGHTRSAAEAGDHPGRTRSTAEAGDHLGRTRSAADTGPSASATAPEGPR